MSEEDRQQLVSNHHIPAFEIDPRISLDIEYELAVSLGKLVLD